MKRLQGQNLIEAFEKFLIDNNSFDEFKEERERQRGSYIEFQKVWDNCRYDIVCKALTWSNSKMGYEFYSTLNKKWGCLLKTLEQIENGK